MVESGQFLVTPQLTITRAIVAAPRKSRKQMLQDLAQVVAEIRQEAREKGLDKIPAREISRAVAAARHDLKKSKPAAK